MLSCKFSEISKNTFGRLLLSCPFYIHHLFHRGTFLDVGHFPSTVLMVIFSRKKELIATNIKLHLKGKNHSLFYQRKRCVLDFWSIFIFLRFITWQKQPPEVFCKKDVLRNWCSNKVAAWGLKLIKNRLRHFCRPAFFYRTCWTTASDFILHLDKPSLEFSDKFFHVW